MDNTPKNYQPATAARLRYGEFLGMVRVKMRTISYNDAILGESGKQHRHHLRPVDVHRLLTPYVASRLFAQMRAVVPLAIFLMLFLMLALGARINGSNQVFAGLAAVILGLMLFMEGVKHGLMPFAESIGFALPDRAPRLVVLVFAFLLGAIATLAEPAIGALRLAGGNVDAAHTPVLYLLLNEHPEKLVLAVGLGVGLAVVTGMLRFIHGWPMKRLVMLTLIPCLAATIYAGTDPHLAPVLGLAWDCGAITTGPVTVPLVLALGIGVAASASGQDSPLAGFGIVTLASLFPAFAVIAVAVSLSAADAEVLATAVTPAPEAEGIAATLFEAIFAALRAILPLILLLWLVFKLFIAEPLRRRNIIVYGVSAAVIGMALFNIGLSFGLAPLGTQAGTLAPTAFAASDGQQSHFPYWFGLLLVLFFAATLGFAATLAEPALNALGATVETLTDGAYPKQLLIRTVAIGVACGTTLGIARIIFQWPMLPLLLIGYGTALLATWRSSEEYVSLAWDSAGVTTGPVTVPLVLALGLGLGETVGAAEGFGILSMASVGPIVSVLLVGLWIKRHSDRRAREGA